MPATASRCIGSSAATRTASLRSRCTAGRARRAHLGFELGLLTLLVRLVVRRLAPWWSPVLVLLGFVPIAVNPTSSRLARSSSSRGWFRWRA